MTKAKNAQQSLAAAAHKQQRARIIAARAAYRIVSINARQAARKLAQHQDAHARAIKANAARVSSLRAAARWHCWRRAEKKKKIRK